MAWCLGVACQRATRVTALLQEGVKCCRRQPAVQLARTAVIEAMTRTDDFSGRHGSDSTIRLAGRILASRRCRRSRRKDGAFNGVGRYPVATRRREPLPEPITYATHARSMRA